MYCLFGPSKETIRTALELAWMDGMRTGLALGFLAGLLIGLAMGYALGRDRK